MLTGEFLGTERYVVLRRLGQGGMGVVYAARDNETGREVALKTLSEPSRLLWLKHEFRSLAGMRHYNLVSLYELVSSRDRWFFTMELIDGVDVMSFIHAHLASAHAANTEVDLHAREPAVMPGYVTPTRSLVQGRVDFDLVREVMGQLATGVSALHESGVLHQDLKPSNVLVTASGRVVIVDFGLTATLSAPNWNEGQSAMVGTPAYMAPEQATPAPPSEAADWYAVGVILYEALTGALPFSGPGFSAIHQKQFVEPPPPRVLDPDIPKDLSALCVELLRRDPTTRPTGGAVLSRLGVAVRTGGSRRWVPGDLIGRTAQRAALDDAFTRVQSGGAATVFVQGRSGMGKTALVHGFLDDKRRASNVLVLSGRCYERESVPYKAIDALIDSLAQYLRAVPDAIAIPDDTAVLARMFPVLRQFAPEAEDVDAGDAYQRKRRAVAALRELLARIAATRPVVLFIDDLHWGDADSAPIVTGLLRPPSVPLLFVATYRAEEGASPLLHALLASEQRPADIIDIEVGALPVDETTSLVERVLARHGAVERDRIEAIVHESEGHPFFIHELCRIAITEPELASSQRGLGVDALIRAEVGRLPKPAQRLIEVIALAGQPIGLDVAAVAAGVDRSDEVLETVRSAQLIRRSAASDAPHVELHHDRIREALVKQLDAETRRAHHRALAEAFEASPSPDLETLSVHYAAAGEPAKALRYTLKAADLAAGAMAHARAARLYELALGMADSEPVLAKLAHALVAAGRGAEAAERFTELAQRTTGPDELEYRRLAAEQYLRSGYLDRGVDALHNVLGRAAIGFPRSPRGAVPGLLLRRLQLRLRGTRFRTRAVVPAGERMELDACWSAAVGLSLFDPVRGAAFATRALLLALRVGEPRRIATALAMQAGHLESGGASLRADRLLQQAEHLAAELVEPHLDGFITATKAIIMNERAEFAASLVHCDRAEAILRRCTGVAWELHIVELFRMTNLYYLGRLRDIGDILPKLMAANRERGDLFAAMNLETLFLPFLMILQGKRDEARRLVDAVDRWAPGRFYVQHMFALETRTMADLTEGEVARAYERILANERALDASLLLHDHSIGDFWRFLRATTTIAAAAVNPPERRRMLRAATAAGRRLLGNPTLPFRAMGKLVLHSVAYLEGDHVHALALARQALAGFEATGLQLHDACTRWRIGTLIGGDEGATHIAAARGFLVGEGVADVEAIVRVYTGLPG